MESQVTGNRGMSLEFAEGFPIHRVFNRWSRPGLDHLAFPGHGQMRDFSAREGKRGDRGEVGRISLAQELAIVQ